MADSAVAITAGSGTNIDTRTESTNSNHRQVVVLGDPATNAGVAPVDVDDGLSVIAAGRTDVFDLTPTCLTSALDAADVLADTEVLSACFRANDKTGLLQSLTVIDKDDNGAALKVYIFDANVSLGTEGAAVSITDANADNILAVIDIAASDYHDLIGSQVANIRNLSVPIKPPSGTDDLYVAIQGGSGNTSTYTASGLVLRFGIMQD